MTSRHKVSAAAATEAGALCTYSLFLHRDNNKQLEAMN